MKAYMSDKARNAMRNPDLARKLVAAGSTASKTGQPQIVQIEGETVQVRQVNFAKGK